MCLLFDCSYELRYSCFMFEYGDSPSLLGISVAVLKEFTQLIS